MMNAFTPTSDQRAVLSSFDAFLNDEAARAFILCGAAGTGKTTMLQEVAQNAKATGLGVRLTSPTGRASRILSEKTGLQAQTIHSLLFQPTKPDDEGVVRLMPRRNEAERPEIILVDEASMVGQRCNHEDGDLLVLTESPLDGLRRYLSEGSAGSKVVFIGDRFQLPPVKEGFSPALCRETVEQTFGDPVYYAELTTVLRQAESSPVLVEATHLRRAIAERAALPKPRVDRAPSQHAMVTRYLDGFSRGAGYATMIACSNMDVNRLNHQARQLLGKASSVIAPGDPVVLRRPWLSESGQLLVNAEPGVILEVGSAHSFAKLTFIEVTARFESGPVSALILADTLTREVSSDEEKFLISEAIRTNPRYRESRDARTDQHVGAMRLAYGHALTCHRAQGGEWDEVFLHPYLSLKASEEERGRWMYTALTRARKSVTTYAHPHGGQHLHYTLG